MPGGPKPEVIKFLEDLGDLIGYLFPVVADSILKSKFETDLEKLLPSLTEDASWTGAGTLLYVPMGQDPGTSALFYGGIRVYGTGSTPSNIIGVYLSEPQISPPNPIWFSEEKSFYVWLDPKNKKVGIIEYPFSKIVLLDGLAIANDKLLAKAVKAHDEFAQYLNAVEVLAIKAEESSLKLEIQAAHKVLKDTAAKIDAINAELATNLEKERKISSFLQKIKILGALVSVGQLALEFASQFPDSEIPGMFDGDAILLENEINSYKQEIGDKIIYMKGELSVYQKLSAQEAIKLKTQFSLKNAPKQIQHFDGYSGEKTD